MRSLLRLPFAALGIASFALAGCAVYPDNGVVSSDVYRQPAYGYPGAYVQAYPPGYVETYPGYVDAYPPRVYGRSDRDDERARQWWRDHQRDPRYRQDQRDPRVTPRPDNDRNRYSAPGAHYQRPYGPDRDPDDERFAPGGRP
jgi:hypothetical protein